MRIFEDRRPALTWILTLLRLNVYNMYVRCLKNQKDINIYDTNVLIRIAWYDRETSKYDYGSWKHFKVIKEMKEWVYKQNRLYQKLDIG